VEHSDSSNSDRRECAVEEISHGASLQTLERNFFVQIFLTKVYSFKTKGTSLWNFHEKSFGIEIVLTLN
jgi:hypothetical protein